MRIYTAHVRPRRNPVLVREGFSWAALLFGPAWLLLHRAWIAAVLTACAIAAIALAAPGWTVWPLTLGLAWLLGLFGQDIRRWSLGLSGFELARVIAAPDADHAWTRLVESRPELLADAFR